MFLHAEIYFVFVKRKWYEIIMIPFLCNQYTMTRTTSQNFFPFTFQIATVGSEWIILWECCGTFFWEDLNSWRYWISDLISFNSKVDPLHWFCCQPAAYTNINCLKVSLFAGLSSSVSSQGPGYTYKSGAVQKQAPNTRWSSYKTIKTQCWRQSSSSPT